jgi:hypothetical protein
MGNECCVPDSTNKNRAKRPSNKPQNPFELEKTSGECNSEPKPDTDT